MARLDCVSLHRRIISTRGRSMCHSGRSMYHSGRCWGYMSRYIRKEWRVRMSKLKMRRNLCHRLRWRVSVYRIWTIFRIPRLLLEGRRCFWPRNRWIWTWARFRRKGRKEKKIIILLLFCWGNFLDKWSQLRLIRREQIVKSRVHLKNCSRVLMRIGM